MKKKLLVFLLALVTLFSVTSCGKKYTVKFDSNGGSKVESVEVKKNKTVSEPKAPEFEGYEFVEWQLNGKKYDFSSKVKGDITLKAVWEKVVVEHKHTASSTWESDDNNHWHKCTDSTCNELLDKAAHAWKTTGSVKECTVCGKKVQIADPNCKHPNWIDATCTAPKTCADCGATEGVALEHTWTPATYTEPATCTVCGATGEGPLVCDEHVDNDNNNKCDNCGEKLDTGDVTYKAKWPANKQTGGWNGNGMTVKILVLPKSSFDPFDNGYNQSNKKIMQKQIRLIEAAYGIDLVYEDWPDAAPWGPIRVEYIKTKTNGGDFANEDVYVVNIASAWVPTLVKAGCLAELATLNAENNADSGIFTEIGYQETYEGSGEYVPGTYMQNPTNNQVVSSLKKVYGYVQGSVHPDYFMYFNADMIAEAGMEDPAELWLKGEWTWNKFEQYCAELQASLSSLGDNYYALSVGFPEFVIGSVASTGGKIATTRPSINLTSLTVLDRFQAIQNLYASGCYEARNVEDVSAGFLEKRVAIVHGDLWFINDASRFDPAVCDFVIGAVPYPTADNDGGEVIPTSDPNEAIKGYDNEPLETEEGSGIYISGVDMSASSFAVPYGSTGCNSIIDTPNGKNGISNKIIFAILYDLYDGLGADPEQAEVSNEVAYRNFLLTKFDRELYADVLMSVQDYTYFELIELVSMTVGGGSHFGTNAFWPLAASICKKKELSPSTELNAVIEDYKEAMRAMGYIVA